MSVYTTEIRYICETLAGYVESQPLSKVAEIIEAARPQLFDFDYPIFDSAYKSVLETKIIRHYYTREIGAETVGLFKFWLETKLNEIMPYYNQLYQTTVLDFNPLYTMDYTTTHSGSGSGTKDRSGSGSDQTKRTGSESTDSEATESGSGSTTRSGQSGGTTSGTKTESGTDYEYFSDTPQGGINGVESMTYLTNATKRTHSGSGSEESETSSTTSETTTTTTSGRQNEQAQHTVNFTDNTTRSDEATEHYSDTDSYTRHVSGFSQSPVKSMMEFRESLLNLDMMIINDLSDLFINLWD